MSTFKNKVVLITGGTSGIGKVAAEAFAKQGAKVVVSGRRAAEGEAVVQAIGKLGGEGRFVAADVSKKADVETLVKQTVEKFGRIDVAFNNAGVEAPATVFHEADDAGYDLVFDVNVRGLWWSMQAEVRQMLKQGGGSIINTSSIAGLIGFPQYATYVAAKHAVIGFTKTAALEYAKSGIRVNAVAPAAIQTDMIDRFAPNADAKNFLASLHPIGRLGRPEEIASAVLWLGSDDASFVTGQTITVDGGFTAQ